MNFERNAFVAWNPSFLERTASSEDEIKSAKLKELLAFDESWLPLSDEGEGAKVGFVSCAFRRSFGAAPVPGYILRSQGKIGYVMLEVFASPSVQFDQGRIVALGSARELKRAVAERMGRNELVTMHEVFMHYTVAHLITDADIERYGSWEKAFEAYEAQKEDEDEGE